MRLFCRRFVLAACAAILLGGAATAQDYPSRPVKIVVPYPAGGSNDIIARIVAQKLSERSGQNFLVENRGGAGGNVGAEAVAASEPDGYTLLLTAPPPLTINAALYKSLPFDPSAAFAPVALIASVPIVLAVHPSLGVNDVKGLIALAKAKPGTINFGSSGIGTTNHLAGELLKSKAGIDIVHVPYKGAAPAMNDLIAGHIPMMFDNIPAVLPQVQAQVDQRHCGGGRCPHQRVARRADGRRAGRRRLRSVRLVRPGGAGENAGAGAGKTANRGRGHPAIARRSKAFRRARRGARHGVRRSLRQIPR